MQDILGGRWSWSFNGSMNAGRLLGQESKPSEAWLWELEFSGDRLVQYSF